MRKKDISFEKFAFAGGLYNYLGTFFSSVLSFFILRLLVQHLAVENYGLYSLVVATFIFLSLVLNWGVPYVVTRFFSEYVEKKQWGSARRLLSRSYFLILLSFIPFWIGTRPLARILSEWLRNPEISGYVSFILILSFLRSGIQISENALNAFLVRKYVVGWGTGLLALRLLLFYAVFRYSGSFVSLLVAWSATELALLAAYLIKLRLLLLRKGEPQEESATFEKGIFRFGLSAYANNFLYFLLDTRIDLYMISHFLNRAVVGWYAFATQLTNLLYSFSPATVLKSVITPLFVRQYAKTGSLEEQKFLFRMNCKFQAFILFPVFAISAVLMPSLIPVLFHRDYLTSLPPFWILSGLGLIEVVGGPLTTFIWVLKRPDIFIKASGVASLFWIVASYILTQKWGMVGTAFASGLSLVLTFIFQHVLLQRTVRLETPWKSLGKVALHACFAGTVVFSLRNVAASLVSILTLGSTGILIFLLCSFWKKIFDDEERNLLQHAFPIRFWVF